MEECDVGLVGLAVMGQNLVLNLESRGYKVAIYNRTAQKTREFMEGKAKGKRVNPAESIADFVALLKRPRRILLMVKAGEAVDRMLSELAGCLDAGDVIADGGNSHYRDTERRASYLASKGIHYMGTGISGGEEGALYGPSIMIGGPEEGYRLFEGLMASIAARVDGEPCAARMGPGGAGHLVKMVHNGIEYAIMQAIAEAYHVLKTLAGMTNRELANTFNEYNQGELNSYLMEITSHIFEERDPETGEDMIDLILDQAGQKGTGRWTVETAMEAGTPVPTISAAVEARALSACREQRLEAAGILALEGKEAATLEKQQAKEDVKDALSASLLCAFAQGMALLKDNSGRDGYSIPLAEAAAVWRGGCIIRTRLLDTIRKAFRENPELDNILFYSPLAERIRKAGKGLAATVGSAAAGGIPVAAMSASLAYLFGIRSKWLPANLIQAQRDYFGAHTFHRIDRQGVFHHFWRRF